MKNYIGGVFFDIDGTLINLDKGIDKPTQKTIDVINKLRDEGYLVGIATGRMHNYIPKSIMDLDLEVYITSNGAVSKYRGKNIVDDCVDPELLNEALDFLDENNCKYIVAHDSTCYYSGKENDRFIWITENIYPLADKKVKASKVTSSYTDEILEKFRERFGEKLYTLLHRQNLDFGDINVTKASGIRKTADYFNINLDNIYTFGDDTNDIEMVSQFKHGVAMTPHVKELDGIADYVTDSVKNEGIYKAFKHYGLI